MHQNIHRLEHPAYCVPKVFHSFSSYEYPADWVGRSLLAATLLARTDGREPVEAERIISELPHHLNSAGYLGDVLNPKKPNELQLAFQTWVVRGLHEYYGATRAPRSAEMLSTMIRNLAMPVGNLWKTYPLIRPRRQRGKGGAFGSAEMPVHGWTLTSDIGSLFMLLDGFSQAYQFEPTSKLKGVIDEGIECFLKMDLLETQAQVHASLTTLRGLLRMHMITGDATLLRAVTERYALYRRVAMTESYANCNWFGRRNTWTEPCAVIDSFMLAVQLWQITERVEYLEDAHLIWFNGVGRGQRGNGGFGLDTCAGLASATLKIVLYEAFWCCTMRGGEGHSFAAQCTYHLRPTELAITMYVDSRAELDLASGHLSLEQTTKYPYAGITSLRISSSTLRSPITLRFLVPSWMQQPRLTLNGKSLPASNERGFLVTHVSPAAGDVLEMNSSLKSWSRPAFKAEHLPGGNVFHVGPLVMGNQGHRELALARTTELLSQEDGTFRVAGHDDVLTRINYLNDLAPPSHDALDDSENVRGYENLKIQPTPIDQSCPSQVVFREP
jgi:hypothetical protein